MMLILLAIKLLHVPPARPAEANIFRYFDSCPFARVEKPSMKYIECRLISEDRSFQHIGSFGRSLRDADIPSLESLEPEGEILGVLCALPAADPASLLRDDGNWEFVALLPPDRNVVKERVHTA